MDRRTIAASLGFLVPGALGFLAWMAQNGPPILSEIPGRPDAHAWSYGLAPLAVALPVALAMLVPCAALLVSRIHLRPGATVPGMATLGATLAYLAWIGVTGRDSIGSDFAEFSLFLLVVGAPLCVLGAGVLALLSRKKTAETRAWIARAVWLGAMLALLWLDAGTLILAFSVEEGSWWMHHSIAAGVLCAILICCAPLARRYRGELVSGILAISAWSMLLPWIPWSGSKRMALDIWSIQGQPLAVVQEVMAHYRVDVHRSTGEDAEGWVHDLDLVALQPSGLTFYPGLGGSSVGVRGGIVSGASFCYD